MFWGIGGSFCIVGLVIGIFFLPKLGFPWVYNKELDEFYIEPILERMPLVLITSYSVMFVLFVIVKYKKFQRIIRSSFYDVPKKGIQFVSDFEITKIKILPALLLLHFIITFLTSLLFLVFTVGDVYGLIPLLSDFYEPPYEIKSNILAKFLGKELGSTIFVFLGIGAFWIFLLRQIRASERENKIEKYRGSRSLIIYLYSVLGLFLTKLSLSDHSESNNGCKFYEIDVFGECTEILIIFVFVVCFSVLSSFFVYFLERFLFSKIRHKI